MKGYLVIFRGNLFMTTGVKLGCGCVKSSRMCYSCAVLEDPTVKLVMRKLRSMSEFPDKLATQHPEHLNTIYSLDYCHDLVKGMAVLREISTGLASPGARRYQNSALLECLVNPCKGRHVDAGFRPVLTSATAAVAATEAFPEAFPELFPRARGEKAAPATAAVAAGANYAQVANLSTGIAGEDSEGSEDSEDSEDTELPFLNEIPEPHPLHPTQRALLEALKRPVEGVQGPPGTGKSTLVRFLLRERLPRNGRNVALLMGAQNKVVDLHVRALRPYVATDFATSRVGLLVVGHVENVRLSAEARSFTVEGLLAQNAEVAAARLRFDAARARKAAPVECELLRDALFVARAAATATLFRSVRVLVCTLTEIHKLLSSSLREEFLDRCVLPSTFLAALPKAAIRPLPTHWRLC
jgi:hypothetical protein